MGFGTTVSEQALVACSRHCALCHRFCGTNIELHHIEQRADGGEDTFENCIPLCFDCHAEVGHYNPKHPKGKKFTAEELRRHRDSWYTKVAASNGPVQDERFAALDLDVIARLQRLLPRSGKLSLLRNFDYGGAFDERWHDELKQFDYEFQGPEHEFIDADLEGLAKTLKAGIERFLAAVATQTWETGSSPGIRSIPHDWEWKQPERWEAAREQLNDLAESVATTYDELIRLARIKLGVLPASSKE